MRQERDTSAGRPVLDGEGMGGGAARLLAGGFDEAVIGREPAHGVGGGGVTRQVKRLAPAAAEVDAALVTAAAGLGHPRLTAECVESGRVAPDLRERPAADVLERELGQRVG